MKFNRIAFALLPVFLTISHVAVAQFFDDFSDGNFSQNPRWEGDTDRFRVSPAFELQLYDTSSSKSSPSSLVTPSNSVRNATWEFKFRLGFNPSSSNYACYYLMSNQRDLTGALNGYYVRIGGRTGSTDEISLYKQTGSSQSQLITGRVGTVASSPSGWIKVSRDSLGNWELLSDTSAQRTGYVLEGQTSDADHIISDYTGVYCRYTSTRDSLFYFDSVDVKGGVYGDTIRPEVLSYSVLDNKRIQVNFSEKVESVSALNASNYTLTELSTAVYVDSALTYLGTDSSKVIYYLKDTLGRSPQHIFTILGVEDNSGNVMSPFNVRFVYPSFTEGSFGDIIINEFMCDPTPQVLLPDADWVELYNRSTKTFQLEKWEFSDRTSTGKVNLPPYLLEPGKWVILCHTSDSSALASFGGDVLGLPSFPNLNNSDDLLTIRDTSGRIIDQVEYTDDWYGDPAKEDGGYTLERINPDHPCSDGSNWRATNDSRGGTPGSQNSIFDSTPDTVRPVVLSAQLQFSTQVALKFSKALDSLTLLGATYTLSGGLGVNGVSVSQAYSDEAVIDLSGIVVPGQVYTLTVSDLKDCFGNDIQPNENKFGLGKTPGPLEVIINEIFPIPDDSKTTVSSFEYVELYNTTGELLSLDSCFFSDRSTQTSLSGGLIEPEGHLIICENAAVAELSKYGTVLGLSSWPSLNNTGDLLTVSIDSSRAVHHVEYDDDWYRDDEKKQGGWSLEMIDPDNPCDESNNWKASIDASGGSPGKVNSVKTMNPPASGPNLLRAELLTDTTLELFFDQSVIYSSTSELVFVVSNGLNAKYERDRSIKSFSVVLDASVQRRIVYRIEVLGLINCYGLEIEDNEAPFGIPESGEPGDVVINEVLFDPYPSARTDFVEILNRSEKIIDLKNWVICNYDDNLDTLEGFKTISEEGRSLIPGGLVLLSRDNADVLKHYPTNNPSNFIELESMPSYPNDEGTVVLLNDSGLQIDRLRYSADWHHVLIKDPNGISLERLDPDRITQDQGNWHSAAQPVGFGTPGVANSQFSQPTDYSSQVQLQPETFSPDNDGFDDVLFVNYSFDRSGYVGSIAIYDVEGRHVIDLANNELLATEGSYTWDGSTKENSKANAGIYVIRFQIIDEQGNSSKFKKVCVLAVKF